MEPTADSKVKAPETEAATVRRPNEADAHPDLPEFQEFLSSIGYGHTYRWADAPSDPQPTVPPEPPPARGVAWNRRDWVVAALPAATVLLVVGWLAEWSALSGGDGAAEAGHTTSTSARSPFFSLEGFRAIRLGMSDGEVRDLAGLPASRRCDRGDPTRECWSFTGRTGVERVPVPLCTVWLANGRVVGTEELPPMPQEPTELPVLPAPVQVVGDLTVTSEDRRPLTLRAADPGSWVLINPACVIPMPALPASTRPALRLASPKAEPSNGPEIVLPGLSVYARGELTRLPLSGPKVPEEALREDLAWLLQRLERPRV